MSHYRQGFFTHSPIDFYFQASQKDFVVNEIPLYEASGMGEHLYIHIRKKNLSTFEMLDVLSNVIGVKKNEIGYAGLKDKHALTTQIITLPKKYLSQIEHFTHENIKILNINYHHNKMRIGHLKGNRFFMRLKKVNPTQNIQLQSVFKQLNKYGIANYFGYQRFGIEGNNYELAKKILKGEHKIRDKKKRDFLISAFQSHLFNEWLDKRVEFSRLAQSFSFKELQDLYPTLILDVLPNQPHIFKILIGDIMVHYPFGKIFHVENTTQEANRFYQRDIVPTGLLSGLKVKKSFHDAFFFEEPFIQEDIHEYGSRREAWIFPDKMEYNYIQEKAHVELHFSLPKGAYATVFLEQLANRSLKDSDPSCAIKTTNIFDNK